MKIEKGRLKAFLLGIIKCLDVLFFKVGFYKWFSL